MYAVTCDMDISRMEELYGGDSWHKGYAEIGCLLCDHGFDRKQGGVYFGDDSVNAVTCVLAVQDVTRRLPWFRASVRDVRMLRIEANNDLSPAIELALEAKRGAL
ncbi:MAG: virulence factor [Pseudomonadota bacterium]